MSVSPRLTRQDNRSRPPAPNTHTNENHNSNRSNTNGEYMNSIHSVLFRNRRDANNSAVLETTPLIDTNLPSAIVQPKMESENKNSQPPVDDGISSNRTNEDVSIILGSNSEITPNPVDDVDGDESDRRRRHGPNMPFSPSIRDNSEFPEFDIGSLPELTESIPDVNVYQHKKTLAQGMMDLALFSANANQLRYVLDSSHTHPYYYSGIVLISISLLFQVAIGVGLIWNSRFNVKDDREICIANKINNFTIIGIFLVTLINVFICGFGVANVQTVAPTPVRPVGS